MPNIKGSLSFLRSALLLQRLSLLRNLMFISTVTLNTRVLSAMNIFEDVSLSTVDIIKNNGYAVEVHNVTTEDGYILELHRIPRSRSGQEPFRNHPVFLHHGILGSSADWVLGGADKSLPMQLADAGYDVWLANCRGNTYSKKHVSMTSKQKAFWNFSLNEVGTYDLPAAFDYILKNNKASQLHYIGYSMGSCVFFIMASERPEYQIKIRSQISLAPVAFLFNTRSSIRYLVPYANILNFLFQRMSKGMLMPQSKMQQLLAKTVCKEKFTQKMICEKCIIFSVCGSDPHYFDTNLIPLIMGHFPAGTSVKLAVHFSQFISKDGFGQFDYGPTTNVHHYNSTVPPAYDLKSIQVPITLMYGENDLLADKEDVMRLKAQLPKLVDAFPVNNTYCNHVDFMWSVNVTEVVNDPVKGILSTTDAADWKYSGPKRPTAVDETRAAEMEIHRPPPLVPIPRTNDPSFMPVYDYLAVNLDAIIANAMPRIVDENDVEEFRRERDLQKILFGNVIEFMKSTEKRYGRLRDEYTNNEISDWTDDAIAGISVARNAVGTRVKNTTVQSSNDRVGHAAGKSVAVGAAIAENAVVVGVAKAERSVVGGIVKAEHLVNYGLNKADRVVANVFHSVWSGKLSRAFWYFK